MKVYLVCSIVVGWNRQKGVSGDARYFFLHGITGSYLIFCFCNFILQGSPKYERYYGNYNEDYYEPFCDFHSETGYSLHAHDKKHQSKNKEDYRKID